jgi:chromosome segregation ATPase
MDPSDVPAVIAEIREEISEAVEAAIEEAEGSLEVAEANARARLAETTAAIAVAEANAAVEVAENNAAEVVAETNERIEESTEWLRERCRNLEMQLAEMELRLNQLSAPSIPPALETSAQATTETEASPPTLELHDETMTSEIPSEVETISPSDADALPALERASEAVAEVLAAPVIRFL